VREEANELKARRASSSPDVSIVNKTLDTIEGLVESINSSAISILSDVMSASSAFSDVLTDFQSSIDDAATQLEENEDSEDSDAAESEELKSFISWATTLVDAVNKTVLSVNEQVPQLQAQVDSTLSQVMPPLRSKADEIFGAVNDATEQLDAISADGLSSGDDSLLARPTSGVVETGKTHANKMSLLEVRASRGQVALSKARLEFAIARKGGGGVCDTVQAKISAANSTVIGFSEMLSGVNSTFVDALAAVTDVVETGLQAVLNATQEKMDASEDAGVDPTNKALSILSSGAEKLQAALEKLPLTSDKDLGDAESSIMKAQASLASLSDSLDDMKSAADEACSLVSGELPGEVPR
jgi:chromosome segregation ATPase